jgi:hypothetical protein
VLQYPLRQSIDLDFSFWEQKIAVGLDDRVSNDAEEPEKRLYVDSTSIYQSEGITNATRQEKEFGMTSQKPQFQFGLAWYG